MNISAIKSSIGFSGPQSLGDPGPGMEWASDNGVDGPYPRQKSSLERRPDADTVSFSKPKIIECPEGYHVEFNPETNSTYFAKNRC